MALQIQDKVVQTFAQPNIADIYGTYPSTSVADIAVTAAGVKCAGLTVGIKDATTGVVTEYWYQPDGQGGLELVEKQKASSNIFGYYNPVDEKFYEEDTFATEITGDSDSIYIDVTTNAMYRWDVAESTFVLMNDQSGEKKVSGTVTHNYRKTITAEVGSYSNAEIVYNENWRYIDLYVHKNETVFYKAKEHRSGGSSQARTQPIAFVDSNGIVRLNPTGNYGEVMIDSYRALDDGVFTVNVRYDSSGWDDAYLYVIRTQGGGIDERVDGLITRVDALQGKDGIDFRKAAMDDSDTSAQDLNNRTNTIDLKQLYPWCNKFGNRIQLTCKVATMGILRFWFDTPGLAQADTPSVYDHRLLTIDDTYIKLYDMHDTTTAIDTVAHGLTIDGYLSVNLNCLDDGTMRVSINTLDSVMTIDGNDYCILTHWNYGVGRIKLVSDGCELTDVQLSVGNDMFRSPFWMFGASQEGLKDSRYAGQLKKMGYLNVLDNARSGRSSDYALDDLERALTFGQPKYLYFSLSNDGYEPSTYEARLQAVAELASEKGMTLIVMARAVHPQAAGDFNATPEQQLAKRNFIISIVQRVFDFGKAVSADPEDPEAIYEGYLDEAYLHPANAMAANAVAMQFLADVPEIMQYGGLKLVEKNTGGQLSIPYGSLFGGVVYAQPLSNDNVSDSDHEYFYLAYSSGTYQPFNVTIPATNHLINIIRWDSVQGWTFIPTTYTKEQIDALIQAIPAGVGIASITKIGTSGLIDTYRIVFTDNTTTTFQVTNGADGQDAVNPFKGWWPDLATLKAAVTATPGDSAYVKDASPATTWSIYVYDSTASTDNYWADSGTDADTSNVQTFASGEEVNEVFLQNIEFSPLMKDALLTCLSHVAWADQDGHEHLQQLRSVLYNEGSIGIEAIFTQGLNIVYDQGVTSLGSLESMLVVNVVYANGTRIEVSDYSLSGTLTVGTSTVTVTWNTFTTTFDVSVTGYGSIMRYDFSNGILNKKGAEDSLNDHLAIGDYNTATKRRFAAMGVGLTPLISKSGGAIPLYGIPVPKTATQATVSVTPNTQLIAPRVYQIIDGYYNIASGFPYPSWSQGTYEMDLSAQDGVTQYYIVMFEKKNASGTAYSSETEPTNIVCEFE